MMRKRKRDNGKCNGQALTCPHCGAGADGVTLGLHWDFDEHCWRCIMCGYRGYEHVLRPRSKAEVVAERIWDEILDELDKADNRRPVHLSSRLIIHY
jgi:rubredoxin